MVKNQISEQNVGSIFSGKRSKDKKPAATPKPNGEQIESAETRPSQADRGASGKSRITPRRTYTSLMLDMELYNKIREIARSNNLPNSEIMDSAMRKFVELYEAKNGPVIVAGESKISADSLI